MAWYHGGVECPKPQPRLLDRMERRLERDRQASVFRAAVWKRDEGICQACGRKVKRTTELVKNRGEVHHIIPRSTGSALKYDPTNGVLVCAPCHLKLTRKEITL
jgi:5-methylcytosine-specific restriction endonuclease McrA